MKLHLDKEVFKQLISKINSETNIDYDILEKDYYVCLILKDLAQRQDELKAYFKGGTAIYKILDEMNRFSEDIDLTVKVLETESKTQNQKRLKKSSLGYDVDGLELDKEKTQDRKGSITAFYKYESVFSLEGIPLQRAGEIQVEATSFTVSEPTKKYVIEPLLYKLANLNEKKILKDKFNVSEFDIEIITLERMFIDKIFATEFYYTRNMYVDTAKHLYDITILYNNKEIKEFIKRKNEVNKLIQYKRQEEKVRLGGIDENIKIKDFTYLNQEFNVELIKIFEGMQNKYVLNDKYKVTIDDTKKVLNEIIKYMC